MAELCGIILTIVFVIPPIAIGMVIIVLIMGSLVAAIGWLTRFLGPPAGYSKEETKGQIDETWNEGLGLPKGREEIEGQCKVII